MKQFSIFFLGIIVGALALATTRLLGEALETHFWLGARNGFLIGAGFVLTTWLLTAIIRIIDRGTQSLRGQR